MAELFVLEDIDQSEETVWKPIDDDTILEAKLLSVRRVVKPFKDEDGNVIERIEFEFQVTQDCDFTGRRIRGETSTQFNVGDRCKMRLWVQELLGVDQLPAGFRLDTDALLGAQCRIVVSRKDKPRRDDPTKTWTNNQVKDVMRAAKSGPSFSFDDDTEEPF